MKITLTTQDPLAASPGALFLALGPGWRKEIATVDDAAEGELAAEIARQGFQGVRGESALYQSHGKLRVPYVVVVGIGDGAGTAAWHGFGSTVVQRAAELKATEALLAFAHDQGLDHAVELTAEGLLLSDYRFLQLKSTPAKTPRLATVKLAVPSAPSKLRSRLARGIATATGTCYARDLINLPAGVATPTFLAKEARAIGRRQKLQVKVHDEAALRRLGMGALLGVARGSAESPRFLELLYRPAKKAQRSVALGGKGVTFDSGGLSLKSTENMNTMKADMAGAATVVGVMTAAARLKLPVNVIGAVGLVENMVSGSAYKLGDVLTARNGVTIEVLNTDAEGRLVLADVLTYVCDRKVDRIIDLATLTGSCVIALGEEVTGAFTNDQAWCAEVLSAARRAGEPVWQLPMREEFGEQLKSDVADVKNVGKRWGGASIAAKFLERFVGEVPWVHLDIAGPAFAESGTTSRDSGATGVMVRTLVELFAVRPNND